MSVTPHPCSLWQTREADVSEWLMPTWKLEIWGSSVFCFVLKFILLWSLIKPVHCWNMKPTVESTILHHELEPPDIMTSPSTWFTTWSDSPSNTQETKSKVGNLPFAGTIRSVTCSTHRKTNAAKDEVRINRLFVPAPAHCCWNWDKGEISSPHVKLIGDWMTVDTPCAINDDMRRMKRKKSQGIELTPWKWVMHFVYDTEGTFKWPADCRRATGELNGLVSESMVQQKQVTDPRFSSRCSSNLMPVASIEVGSMCLSSHTTIYRRGSFLVFR